MTTLSKLYFEGLLVPAVPESAVAPSVAASTRVSVKPPAALPESAHPPTVQQPTAHPGVVVDPTATPPPAMDPTPMTADPPHAHVSSSTRPLSAPSPSRPASGRVRTKAIHAGGDARTRGGAPHAPSARDCSRAGVVGAGAFGRARHRAGCEPRVRRHEDDADGRGRGRGLLRPRPSSIWPTSRTDRPGVSPWPSPRPIRTSSPLPRTSMRRSTRPARRRLRRAT